MSYYFSSRGAYKVHDLKYNIYFECPFPGISGIKCLAIKIAGELYCHAIYEAGAVASEFGHSDQGNGIFYCTRNLPQNIHPKSTKGPSTTT